MPVSRRLSTLMAAHSSWKLEWPDMKSFDCWTKCPSLGVRSEHSPKVCFTLTYHSPSSRHPFLGFTIRHFHQRICSVFHPMWPSCVARICPENSLSLEVEDVRNFSLLPSCLLHLIFAHLPSEKIQRSGKKQMTMALHLWDLRDPTGNGWPDAGQRSVVEIQGGFRPFRCGKKAGKCRR